MCQISQGIGYRLILNARSLRKQHKKVHVNERVYPPPPTLTLTSGPCFYLRGVRVVGLVPHPVADR